VNLRGPLFLVQEALPYLKESAHAAVLNVVSGAAFLFSATISMYGIGKAGLMAATRSMAAEYAPHGIRVNALSPGTVDTDMVRKNSPEAQAEMTKIQIMPRMAHPDEMVGPALLLTSDAGSFITGQVVFADGGMVPR
jgi:NAD(P)-dependent dehydrogenase (short-subunit alcohol dehydrogenase family)